MALFAITTFILFRFGLDRKTLSGSLAAGVLLATVLFAAILAINRLFVAERDEGGFDAFRLAPVDGTACGGAKAAALIVYLLGLELIAVPVFAIFFLDSWRGLPAAGRGARAGRRRARGDRGAGVVDRRQLPSPRPARAARAAAAPRPA